MVEREMHLFDGRRVRLQDLMDHGLLAAGDALRFERRSKADVFHAVISDDARIRLEDGSLHQSPSPAAAAAVGSGSFDGWHAWFVVSQNCLLADLRREILAREFATTAVEPEAAEGRRSRLKEWSSIAEASNEVDQMEVRELLAVWGATGRSAPVAERILADLDNFGLRTVPDFRKVGLGTMVAVQAIPEEVVESDGQAAAHGVDRGVGTTLGTVKSALAGIESVSPQDTLEKAVTLMRLNDFSQVAVLQNPRKLRGAVTWRSVALAYARSNSPTVADATVRAELRPYDEELLDVIGVLFEKDFVFVADETDLVAGIVTAADVVDLYSDMAAPFFMIGEIDTLLRQVIMSVFSENELNEFVQAGPGGDQGRTTEMSMGEYLRLLQSRERWPRMGWSLDRAEFCGRLDEIRIIRNSIAHFDPDPPDPNEVAKLRNFLLLMRELAS